MHRFAYVFLVITLSFAIITVVLALFQASRGRFGALNYKSHCPDAAGNTFRYLSYALITLILSGGVVLWLAWDAVVL